MKLIGLFRAFGVDGDSSVFSQNAEVKAFVHCIKHDAERLRSSWGQLLEITEQQDVQFPESIAAPIMGSFRVVYNRKSLCHGLPAVDINHAHLDRCMRQYTTTIVTHIYKLKPNLINEQHVQTHENGSLRIALGEVEFRFHVRVQVEQCVNSRSRDLCAY